MASPAAPRVAAPHGVVDRSPTPSATALSALFAALSDGCPHRLDRLAAVIFTQSSSAARNLGEALEALRAAGVPVTWDGDAARSRRCTALDAAAIERRLADVRPVPMPWDVRVVWSTASTNSDLLDEARDRPTAAAATRPTLLVAEIQRAGRGRLGRHWSSAPGASLTMSLSIALPRPLSAFDGVTLVCGLAVRRVLAADGVAARLKWPNDVVVDGAKLVGILVEAHAAGAGTTLVVGIGVNVARSGDAASPASALPATDLERCGATSLDRNRLAARVADAVARDLAIFATTGFAPFAPAWNAVDAFAGAAVTVGGTGPDRDGAARVTGIARGVDDTGALRVETGDGVQRIIAGDVSLRPLPA